MKIIDSHMHIMEIDESLAEVGLEVGNRPDFAGLKKEMKKNEVVGAVLISYCADKKMNDLEVLKKIAAENKNFKCVFGINPYALYKGNNLKRLDKALNDGLIHGIKIYPSYFPFYPADRVYDRAYKLAIKYNVPTIVHTGAVIKEESTKTFQKYAHPLHVDDLAVEYPKLKILMAHSGYPWIIDAAQVAYKNDNVVMDFSGLKEGIVIKKSFMIDEQIRWAIPYVEKDDEIMYGSDWPIINLGRYINWAKTLVPKRLYKNFFYKNVKNLFGFSI